MSSVPADLFTSADPAELAPEFSEGDGAEFEAPDDAENEIAVDEPAAEEEPVAEEEAPEEELPLAADEPPAADELPEGVKRGKDRNGKEGLWLTPQRYEQFHGAFRAVRDFENAIGEPLTADTLDLRNRAYMGQERLYADLTSGDPAAQGKVLGHFFKEARDAQEQGLVGSNPIIPLAQEFYKQVKSDPDAYAHLRMDAARDLIEEMYQEAGAKQDANIWRSAGWIAKSLGLPYKPDAAMQGFAAQQADPMAQLRAENEALKSQVGDRAVSEATAQLNSWKQQVAQSNTKALTDEALIPSISQEQRAAWEKFPTQFQNLVVAPLNRAVREVLGKDSVFQERVSLLGKQAERATSAQARNAIAADMKQLFVNRAKIAAEALKGPILKEAGSLLKQQNDKTHSRRQAAQDQRSPQGSRSPVPRSIIPGSVANNRAGTTFNVNEAVRDMASLLG